MAVPNQFATMLHRNTNKIIVTLVYAVLEWLLISLLLLNSLFNYLINRYTQFFGLKSYCIECGSFLQVNSMEEVSVAAENSKPRYCVLHGRLANSQSDKKEFSIEESSLHGGDGSLTVERLQSALTSERKTLRALYTELEEERSASAIAANHTMAMITRLQEEKAAMQMEALQYQRMMEEQAEYDQEALQLLNGLILKREKEKDELEKELEIYKDQIVEGDCSDDGNQLSNDLSRAISEKQSDYDGSLWGDGDLEEMALDCMKHMSELDESLDGFEEEKLSILNQLKALEEKLFLVSKEGSESRVGDDSEDIQMETMQSMAKQLLPLLDEAESAEIKMEINSVQKQVEFTPQFSLDDEEPKKVDAVQEVDRVYQRNWI